MTTKAMADATLDQLKDIPLLHGLNPSDLTLVLRAGRPRTVERGGFFFRQGDRAGTLYVLTQGQVRLTQATADGDQTLLRFIGPAEMLGAVAIFDQDTYPATAQAAIDCQAVAWDGPTMAGLMERFPHLALNTLHLLAAQLRELQQRYQALTAERVERRLARALTRLTQHAGQKVAGGVLINLPLSREDLAEMTGTTLYTVSRILSRWEREGLAELGRERILIRRPHGLVAIAEDWSPPAPAKDTAT